MGCVGGMGGYGKLLAEGSAQHCGGPAMHPPMAQPVLTQDPTLWWLLALGTRLAVGFPLP